MKLFPTYKATEEQTIEEQRQWRKSNIIWFSVTYVGMLLIGTLLYLIYVLLTKATSLAGRI